MFGKSKEDYQPDLEFFTVYDSKAKNYSEPFPAMNKDVVLRDFVNAFRSPEAAQKNRYYMNAEDFSIFKVGTFTLKTGSLIGQNHEHIANMHDLRAIAQPSGIGAT